MKTRVRIPSTHRKHRAWYHTPVIPMMRGRNRRIPGAHSPVCLFKQRAPGSVRDCLQEKVEGNGTGCLTLIAGLHVCTHTYNIPTHTCFKRCMNFFCHYYINNTLSIYTTFMFYWGYKRPIIDLKH